MKWRKYKKQFKKNIKPVLIGTILSTELRGLYGKVVDVRIKPAGGKSAQYTFYLEPVEPPRTTHYEHEHVGLNKGFDLSFSIPKEPKINNKLLSALWPTKK